MSMFSVALIHEATQLWLSVTRNHHIKLCRRLKPPLIQLHTIQRFKLADAATAPWVSSNQLINIITLPVNNDSISIVF
ncbi:hypothetical protein CORMATOL_03045 [Corynebacterium matruchotii ATCC 33806]|uniref:Uncharacterized protein n=1 Tax=Corynebacterium matruchotii ATCC 33806 TaxID=566549 RepID=C0E7Q4_9CORY|nr:hypothetical protein CORMATOL_03045 [Corynebacterium matruchotii ATCC 33806]